MEAVAAGIEGEGLAEGGKGVEVHGGGSFRGGQGQYTARRGPYRGRGLPHPLPCPLPPEGEGALPCGLSPMRLSGMRAFDVTGFGG